MENHYLESLILKKRREFHSLQQFSSESITQWYTRVKEAADQCDFGEQSNDRIKDQFVNGMEEGAILDCVLGASYKTSLRKIIETALKKEEELRPIEKLPEEILIHIFSYLPIVDRVRVEMVKKSWQEMAKKSWSNLKDLKMDSLYSELKAVPVGINSLTLEAIVSRCGKYVEKIDVDTSNISLHMLPTITKHIPNLRSINCYKVSVDGLKQLSENCRNITEISIKEFEKENELDEALGNLFENNKKLRILNIPEYKGKGDCLSKLPFEKITTIKIPRLRQWEPSELKIINVIEKSKNLSILQYETDDVNVFKVVPYRSLLKN